MWTQRDQLQAFQFLRRRLVSAVQTGDANNPVSPSRRVVVGYLAGAACMLVAVAAFGIYGVLRPGASQQWRTAGQVVIEKETGATYVLMADGLLHPVLNYASARLLAGGDGRRTVTVSARSLAGAARGVPVGIVGAPDSLPAPDRLASGQWTVCAGVDPDQPARSRATTTAALGLSVPDPDLAADELATVVDEAGAMFAVIDGRRWRIRDAATAAALGYDEVPAIGVTAAWLSSVPAAPDLGLIGVTGSGQAGPRIAGQSTVVGQVLVAESVGRDRRYFVVRAAGLESISETQAALILGNPANRSAYSQGVPRPIPVPAELAAQAAQGRPADYPTGTPRPVPVSGRPVICATNDGTARVRVQLRTGMPELAGATPVPALGGQGTDARTADAILIRPGSGALVRELQSPDAGFGTVYLITDQGVRFPIGGTEAARSLGYGRVTPVSVDAAVLALLPVGARLDTASAQRATRG